MVSRRWWIAVVMLCGLTAGCSEFNTNLSTQTSSSLLTFLSPATVTLGSVPTGGLPITANGNGYVTGAVIIWNVGPNQISLTTTFVSATQLTAVIPPSDITTAGTIQVEVQIPGSAVSGSSNINATTTTELSNVVNFTVNAQAGPAPTIASISASTTSLPSTPYCSPSGFTLTVNGTNFASGSTVNWNGSPRTTTLVSSTQLTAVIAATDAASPGTAMVSVSNGSATSNSAGFTLTTPQTNLPSPTITSLSQTTAAAGSATFTLSVAGGSFVPCSVVQWNGSTRATTYVSPTQLNAVITASDILSAAPGGTTVPVTVFTIPPGGGASSAITFTISP